MTIIPKFSKKKGIVPLFLMAVVAMMGLSVFPASSQDLSDSDDSMAADGYVLTVDITQERQVISPDLYGVNVANWCPWYYLKNLSDKIVDANVEVVRLGATNMERYNFETNRMYNVISMQNETVPVSWQSFVSWTKNDLGAKPMLQASVFGNVAGDGERLGDPGYSKIQTEDEIKAWVTLAGDSVEFWGIGNEPWIAWKREDYPDIYHDAAHGDQVLNAHIAHDYYFNRFATVADAIKQANSEALILGPTPANWWLYWVNDYSPYCPVIVPNGPAVPESPQWQLMMDPASLWNRDIFPDRGQNPEIAGWETDPQKNICQYLIRMNDQQKQKGERLADYLDLHRYIRCVTEKDALQEPRGLFHEDFAGWDAETLFSGTRTNLLNRINSAISLYYPGTRVSFSEYGYFYWNGFPAIPQSAAVGMVDYLGFFARGGVDLACSWYLGEPNQSGESVTRAADSARQAMFDEMGNPNPKYWGFYLMSHWFRGSVVRAEANDWERFSVHACERDTGEIVVVAVNKGLYDETGSFKAGQGGVRAAIQGLPEQDNYCLSQLYRFGRDDPSVVTMDINGLQMVNDELIFNFEPLAIYTFVFTPHGGVPESIPPQPRVIVGPERIDFGPYQTGLTVDESGSQPRRAPYVAITNTTLAGADWSIFESADWLSIQGPSSGSTRVTDRVYLNVDRKDLPVGSYHTDVDVSTPEGVTTLQVTMDVIPGEGGGEKRLFDVETGSLAHTYNLTEPYSLGWWAGHGGDNDRNSPYIYEFSIDTDAVHRLGNRYAMKIAFGRANGDTVSGRLFQSFGTYGHHSIFMDDTGKEIEADATGNWQGYETFSFDVKSQTDGEKRTELLLLIMDATGNIGKPSVGLDDYSRLMVLENGMWQTVTIPLDSVFFDWAYPDAQDGSEVTLDFSSIRQIELIPWAGDPEKSGELYLDNFRVNRPVDGVNQFPVASVAQVRLQARPGDDVLLDGSGSYDPDGDGLTYQWIPQDFHAGNPMVNGPTSSTPCCVGWPDTAIISDPASPTPIFSADQEGTYGVELIVTDGLGAQNRNIVQLLITVGSIDDHSPVVSEGIGSTGGGCFIDLLLNSFSEKMSL